MTFTFDLSTSAGKVRLLCTDTDSTNEIFADDEIDVFLELENADIKCSAALALETIASQEVLILKVIENNGLSTDGSKVGLALLKRASLLRAQAEAELDSDFCGFDIAENPVDEFSLREFYYNEGLRS